jgi:hypothetical protein
LSYVKRDRVPRVDSPCWRISAALKLGGCGNPERTSEPRC